MAKITSSKKTKTTKSKKTIATKKTVAKKPVKAVRATSTTNRSLFAKLRRNGSKSPINFEGLKKLNLVIAALHFIQGIAILVLSQPNAYQVTTSFLTRDEFASSAAGEPVLAIANRPLFDVNLAYLLAFCFFAASVAHAIVGTVYRKRYEAAVDLGVNLTRWIEYGLGASTMLVVVAILSGVRDLASLMMVFSLVLVASLLGLVMELHNKRAAYPGWYSYIVGCIAGIVPWVIVGTYLLHANLYGSGQIPAFVYFICGSMFLLFGSVALNMYLQYKRVGKWADYLYVERAYIILSLITISALAWQVFAGALRP